MGFRNVLKLIFFIDCTSFFLKKTYLAFNPEPPAYNAVLPKIHKVGL